jgi:uncharacterized protein (TIGR02271 family)
MSSENNNSNIDWSSVVKKEAIGSEGLDLGEVHEVGETYVITQRGLINKKRYHIPKSAAESFDGDILKLRVSESELESYEQTEDQKFDDYSTFKASDMSREVETKIPLMAEDIEVTKRVTEDKVEIIKEPVRETKTVEIELTHEKITIERRPVTGDSQSGNGLSSEQSSSSIEGPVETRTEISIPVKREEPVITKRPYVKEEIIIRKKPVTETRTITEEVTHEEVANRDILDNKDNREEDTLAEKQ